MFLAAIVIELMFLEPEVQVYSSFDRSGAKGFKCILASLLTIVRPT